MVKFKAINSKQAAVFRTMCEFDVDTFEDQIKKRVAGAPTKHDLTLLRDDLNTELRHYQDSLSTLPVRHTLKHYIEPSGEEHSIFHTTTRRAFTEDHGRINELDLPGRTIDTMDQVYDTLKAVINCLNEAIAYADQRSDQLNFGPDAKSPFREVGFLREHITQQQVDKLCDVLVQLKGLEPGVPHACKRMIDLRPFAKTEAAMILNKMSELMGIKVRKGFNVDVVHSKTTSSWYGGSGDPRNQMTNAIKKDTPVTDRIQAWLDRVGTPL